jgi:hypothetical protein
MRVASHTSPDLRRHWIFDRVVRQVHSACDWHPPNILSVWNVLNLIIYRTTHVEIQIGSLNDGYTAGAQLGCNDSWWLLGRVSFVSSGAEEMRPLRMYYQVINRTCTWCSRTRRTLNGMRRCGRTWDFESVGGTDGKMNMQHWWLTSITKRGSICYRWLNRR